MVKRKTYELAWISRWTHSDTWTIGLRKRSPPARSPRRRKSRSAQARSRLVDGLGRMLPGIFVKNAVWFCCLPSFASCCCSCLSFSSFSLLKFLISKLVSVSRDRSRPRSRSRSRRSHKLRLNWDYQKNTDSKSPRCGFWTCNRTRPHGIPWFLWTTWEL